MNEHTLLSRRNFLKLGAAAVVLAGGGWALGGTSWGRQASHTARALVKGGDLPAEYLRQIIAADNSHCRTIMWQSAAPLDDPQVEFRPAGQSGASAIPAQHNTFTDDGVTCTIYTAQITGLTPGTAYEYRIASGQLAGDWQPRKLLLAINAHLPEGASALRVCRARPDFHARYDAVSREYMYFIWNSSSIYPQLLPNVCWLKGSGYDWNRAAEACRWLEGEHDFGAYCRAAERPEDAVRTMYRVRLVRRGHLLKLHVVGSGFLTNMVRIMVGCLELVARGRK